VPEGSRALAGIGCHFMASWMERETSGLIQMGAEGVDWAAHSRFTKEKHVFQNLGDGTYYHSGYLAIRQAIAAKATITYKILYNDAVAMTGGQPVDGPLSVPEIARQVEAEGAKRVVIVSDNIAPHREHAELFPKGTTFHPREELDNVQRELREIDGVTILIYDQTCAAEKRRRRKKKEYPDPPQRIFINEAVCEGCGDCGQASNCLSVIPVETEWGRKRHIEQSSCNKDYSCINGFCPSFVTVTGATLKKRVGSGFDAEALAAPRSSDRPPRAVELDGPVRHAGDRRRRHRRRHGRRADHDGRAPGGQAGLGARLHGLRAEGRRGAVVRARGADGRPAEPGAHRHPAGRRAARLRHGGGRLRRRAGSTPSSHAAWPTCGAIRARRGRSVSKTACAASDRASRRCPVAMRRCL
jgi:hypothetical protein